MRAGLVHRIDKHLRAAGGRQKRTGARSACQTVLRPYHRAAVCGAGMGKFRRGRRHHYGQHRAQPQRLAEDVRVFEDGSDGKHAVTHWRVLKRYGYVTLVECRLETGRTHQIRVHMPWQGHPLFSDERYGGDRILKGTTFQIQTVYRKLLRRNVPACSGMRRRWASYILCTDEAVYFESELPAYAAASRRAITDKRSSVFRHKSAVLPKTRQPHTRGHRIRRGPGVQRHVVRCRKAAESPSRGGFGKRIMPLRRLAESHKK